MTGIVANGVKQALETAVMPPEPPKVYTTQEKRAWMLLCLAAAATRNGNFTGDESNEGLLDLLNRIDDDTNLLIP